jgi:hypothetical protein
MRQAFVAALTVLAGGDGLAFAQGNVTAPAGVHASVEYLSAWIKNARVPPLVTAGDDGVPGATGTRVLLDNLDFADRARQGGRLTLGYRFERAAPADIEVSYFFVPSRRSEASFASSPSGEPVIGRPFINVATGMPDATRVALPGVAAGSLVIGASTRLSGAEANLATLLVSTDTCHISAVGGLRFLRLEDELAFDERFQVFPDVPGFGGNAVDLHDGFRTVNRFLGAQLGIDTGLRYGALTIDFRGKVGVGQMRQVADIDGVTHMRPPNASTIVYLGGLLALRTNIGRHRRNRLAFLPEASVDVGWPLARNLKAYAGYTLLWVDNMARAGEQIDPVVNTTQFPILSGNGPLSGPARPAFDFAGKDFWMQRLVVGLELRF